MKIFRFICIKKILMNYRNFLFLLTLVSCFFNSSLIAKPINENKAQEVAKNFFKINSKKRSNVSQNKINLFKTIKKENNPLYYIFNLNKNDGWVIVSGDDNYRPILAHSGKGNWSQKNLIPPVQMWLKKIGNEVHDFSQRKKRANTDNIKYLWNKYLGEKTTTIAPKRSISYHPAQDEGLIKTQWGQGPGYNSIVEKNLFNQIDLDPDYACCEKNTNNDCIGIVPTGCVSTAMAQVMKYFNYPVKGLGNTEQSECVAPPGWGGACSNECGTLYANHASVHFNYPEMNFDNASSEAAQLMWHAGQAVKMNYGVGGSSSTPGPARNALKDHFGYKNAELDWRVNDTASSWEVKLINQLNKNLPLIYSGGSLSGGHTWVLDGYKNDSGSYSFHMNWGWEGTSDGYFAMGEINPGDRNYNLFESFIKNIKPTTDLIASSRSFEFNKITNELEINVSVKNDTSGGAYTRSSDLRYYLSEYPNLSSGGLTLLELDTIKSMKSNESDSHSLNIDLDSIFDDDDFGSEFYVCIEIDKGETVWENDEDNNQYCWPNKITYDDRSFVFVDPDLSSSLVDSTIQNFRPCSGREILTSPFLSFTDGSLSQNYWKNSQCEWLIDAGSEKTINLSLKLLKLGEGDTVEVWAIPQDRSNNENFSNEDLNTNFEKLASWNHQSLFLSSNILVNPNLNNISKPRKKRNLQDVESQTGKMLIRFTSDANDESQGFAFSYSFLADFDIGLAKTVDLLPLKEQNELSAIIKNIEENPTFVFKCLDDSSCIDNLNFSVDNILNSLMSDNLSQTIAAIDLPPGLWQLDNSIGQQIIEVNKNEGCLDTKAFNFDSQANSNKVEKCIYETAELRIESIELMYENERNLPNIQIEMNSDKNMKYNYPDYIKIRASNSGNTDAEFSYNDKKISPIVSLSSTEPGSTNNFFFTDKVIYLDRKIERLGPGETKEFIFNFKEKTSQGVIEITLDPEEFVVESNEKNNSIALNFSDEEKYDFIKGDVNLDQQININDIVLLVNHILGVKNIDEKNIYLLDFDKNKNLDLFDLISLVNLILRS